MFLASLALAASAAPPPPVAALPVGAPQDTLSVRWKEGDVLPSGDTIRSIERLAPNIGAAGYAALFRVDPGDRAEIWADFVDDGTSTIQRLYQLPFAPYVDVSFWGFTATQNHLVWEMLQRGAGPQSDRGIFVDGARILAPASPSPIPGFHWGAVPFTSRTTSGTLMHRGSVYSLNGGPGIDTIIESNSTTARIQVGDAIPGTPLSIVSMSYWSTSPDGSHVLVKVGASNGRDMLLLDGEPVELHGEPLRSTTLLGPEALAILGAPNAYVLPTVWGVDVNDAGDWGVTLPIHLVGRPAERWVVRNGRLIAGSNDPISSLVLTEDAVTLFRQDGAVRTGFGEVLRPAPGIDVDGDGNADPGWSMVLEPVLYDENGSGELYTLTYLDGPGGQSPTSITTLPPRLPFRPICSGSPNGAALTGRLYAVGEAAVAANELRLVAHDLPQQASGYALVSSQPSAPVQPPGSVGELCLGGAIGRYASSAFSSGLLGAGTTTLDLDAIPTPTGPAMGVPGQTWFFQVWYRDSAGGAPTSNFTGAIGVTLR
ncbi:MAG: hypothetical protein AAGB93_10930 [Planctomycetota bacterium]